MVSAIFYLFFLFNIGFLVHNQQIMSYDPEILDKLRLSADRRLALDPYDEFDLHHDYQCAVECLIQKQSCTGFFYDLSTNLCSLYNDPANPLDADAIQYGKGLPDDPCDKIQCQPGAICIGQKEPACVCMNGEPTINDCDYIEQGVWSDYDEWSPCSVSCGEGYQYRQRECLASDDKTRKISHEHCIGKHIELRPCDVTTCPTYGPWGPWTPCSTFCGIGVKQRNRSCVPPGSNCGNYTFEQRACGEANCQRVVGIKETDAGKYPMKGYLAVREGDILCIPREKNATAKHMADLICESIGFTRGAQYAVLNPLGENSTCYPGIMCDGTEKSFFECKYDRSQTPDNLSKLFAIIARCIVDGGFSAWSDWSSCSTSCGGGQQNRSRACTEPSPSVLEPETVSVNASLAGRNCTGDYTEVKACNDQQCRG